MRLRNFLNRLILTSLGWLANPSGLETKAKPLEVGYGSPETAESAFNVMHMPLGESDGPVVRLGVTAVTADWTLGVLAEAPSGLETEAKPLGVGHGSLRTLGNAFNVLLPSLDWTDSPISGLGAAAATIVGMTEGPSEGPNDAPGTPESPLDSLSGT